MLNEIGKLPLDQGANTQQNVYSPNGSTYIGKTSASSQRDFTVAYASATTLTLGSYPTGITGFTFQDITSVHQYYSDGILRRIYTTVSDTITISTNTLTIAEGTFGVTDQFIVYTNVAKAGSSVFGIISQQPDYTQTITYLDQGTTDERVTTIVHSSVLLGESITETFSYVGGVGTYSVSTIVLS